MTWPDANRDVMTPLAVEVETRARHPYASARIGKRPPEISEHVHLARDALACVGRRPDPVLCGLSGLHSLRRL
jgi:hypothetical protein